MATEAGDSSSSGGGRREGGGVPVRSDETNHHHHHLDRRPHHQQQQPQLSSSMYATTATTHHHLHPVKHLHVRRGSTTTSTTSNHTMSYTNNNSNTTTTTTATTTTTGSTNYPMNRRTNTSSTASNSSKSASASSSSSASTAAGTSTTGRSFLFNNHNNNKEEEDDRVGIRILELLFSSELYKNQHRHHQQQRQQQPIALNFDNDTKNIVPWRTMTTSSSTTTTITKPILSYRNWCIVRNQMMIHGWRYYYYYYYNKQPMKRKRWNDVERPPKHDNSNNNNNNSSSIPSTLQQQQQQQQRSELFIRTRTTMIRNGVWVVLLSFLGMTTISSMAFTMTIGGIIVLMTLLITTSLDLLLFDYNNNPFLQQFVHILYQLYLTFDMYLLQKQRYIGRDIITQWVDHDSNNNNNNNNNTTGNYNHHQYDIYLLGPDRRRRRHHHCVGTTTTNRRTNVFTPMRQWTVPVVVSQPQQQQLQHHHHLLSSMTTKHLNAIRYCYTIQQQTHHTKSTTFTSRINNKNNNNNNVDHTTSVHIIQSEHDATEVLQRSVNDHYANTSTTMSVMNDNDNDSSNNNNNITTNNEDMAWIDVGAQIGLRLLHSEHVQRAMASQDTKERILETMANKKKTKTITATTTQSDDGDTSSSPKNKSDQDYHYDTGRSNDNAMTIQSSIDNTTIGTATTRTTPITITNTNKNNSRSMTVQPKQLQIVPKPIHTMWTSPGSAASVMMDHSNNISNSNNNNNNSNNTTTTTTTATGNSSNHHRSGDRGTGDDGGGGNLFTSSSFHRHNSTLIYNQSDEDDDDNNNDNVPMLRQSQSYPISPCTPRITLLQLPPLLSPPLSPPTTTIAEVSSTTTTANDMTTPQEQQSSNTATTKSSSTTATNDNHMICQLPDLSCTKNHTTHRVPGGGPLLLHSSYLTGCDDTTTKETTTCISHFPNDDSSQKNITSPEVVVSSSSGLRHNNNNSNRNCSSILQHSRQVGRMYHRLPLLAGMKVAVPMSPYQPNYSYSGSISTTVSSKSASSSSSKVSFMMSTVVRSERIYVDTKNMSRATKPESAAETEPTNCLSVTVKLDKFFLRNGEFAELTFRVYDEWSTRYMPRHSKVPIGSCVATSYGIGVLVGWRVEDDCHIVRSLWQCRGSGSAYAYMNRSSIHKAMVAANGFRVQTVYGWGIVQACVKGGPTFISCRYFVAIREENSRHKGNVLELDDTLILSCHGAQFMPVIEHVRAAAMYQIQLDNYNATIREQELLRGEHLAEKEEQEFLRTWSSCVDILWHSFLKAVEEDRDFDEGVHDFVRSMIEFLDRLDKNDSPTNVETTKLHNASDEGINRKLNHHLAVQHSRSDEIEIEFNPTGTDSSLGQESSATQEPGFWFMNDLFGGIFKANHHNIIHDTETDVSVNDGDDISTSNTGDIKNDAEDDIPVIKKKKSYFNRAFAVLRTIMKTVSIARASSVDHPHLRLALAISYDVLLFLRTILKVQQRNTSVDSLNVWKRAWGEIVATFGPIQERIESIGRGIACRMESQGRKAKVRLLKFVDTILGDERLLFAMEQGEWDKCLARVEIALVEAEVIEAKNLIYYRKAATFVYDQILMLLRNNEGAAARNTEKLAILGHLIQSMAAPRRSMLKVFCREDMLELFERILVRAYYKEEVATRMLTIHAATFHSLRHLRILKDFSVSGRIWIPLLDAADEELSWFVSTLPENSKGIMLPVSRLFSLCVAQFHKINDGDLSKDWLAFLLEEESVQIIQEIDMLLILGLESFSRDIREMMTVLPYYASIDDDILNLMDEVNLDEFLREAASAIDNPDKLAEYIREKATIAIERFLNYLPKMSIPVEKRELGDGWILSCHGSDGGGLTLTDVTIRRENLVCQIMGGDTLFFPMFNDKNENLYHDSNSDSYPVPTESISSVNTGIRCDMVDEESILDHIKVLVMNAQKYGCWMVGFGGICQSPSDPYAASIFRDIPISNVLNCSIELWRNLQIDDDDLLEIAIRDISYHIQLQKNLDEAGDISIVAHEFQNGFIPTLSESASITQLQKHHSNHYQSTIPQRLSSSSSVDGSTAASSQNQQQHRFNPRVDPTVLFLEIKRLTLNLDNFFFRIEKASDKKTIFDPVFAGRGMLSLQNISIRLRVECAKERVKQPAQQQPGVGGHTTIDIVTPILQLRQLEVSLEKLSMTVKDTGFGSDWILNKAVEVFEEKLTEVVVTNLKDQIQEQLVQNILESLNSYFLMNPNLLLNVLGISMDDLDENVVWV